LLPDAKAQVTVLYDEQQNPVTVTKVVLSTQHQKGVSQEQIRKKVIDEIVAPVICPYVQSNALEILINPSGSFTIGGPHGDTGLTGRKIIVDTYGGSCPHGGGAFSGKVPSKVDRSAAYMARYIARHIVAAGLANRATVQLAYAIGVAYPVSVHVNLHGTGKIDEHQLAALINQKIDLTPSGIISRLKLKQTVYRPTASYGHFGRSTFSWEQLDEELLQSMRSKI
jgi:S-adenosylmethionine synthetase